MNSNPKRARKSKKVTKKTKPAQKPGNKSSKRGKPTQNSPRKPTSPQSHSHQPQSSLSLFIGGLNEKTTETALKGYLSQFGEITSVHLIMDWVTGHSKRCAIAQCCSESTVSAILSKKTHKLQKRKLRVRVADDSRKGTKVIRTSRVFIAQITKEITKKDLRGHFGSYGGIVSLSITKSTSETNKAGESMFYCVIEYRDEGEAKRALDARDEHVVKGRRLTCSPYKSGKQKGAEKGKEKKKRKNKKKGGRGKEGKTEKNMELGDGQAIKDEPKVEKKLEIIEKNSQKSVLADKEVRGPNEEKKEVQKVEKTHKESLETVDHDSEQNRQEDSPRTRYLEKIVRLAIDEEEPSNSKPPTYPPQPQPYYSQPNQNFGLGPNQENFWNRAPHTPLYDNNSIQAHSNNFNFPQTYPQYPQNSLYYQKTHFEPKHQEPDSFGFMSSIGYLQDQQGYRPAQSNEEIEWFASAWEEAGKVIEAKKEKPKKPQPGYEWPESHQQDAQKVEGSIKVCLDLERTDSDSEEEKLLKRAFLA